MSLEKELKTYKDKLAELDQHVGQYVVIQGDEVLGIFDTYHDAIRHGYRELGVTPFLVKMIEGVETIHLITRLMTPSPC